MQPNFSTDYESILARIKAIDPVAYGRTRNYIDGDVTYLSPYISRGVISTKTVYAQVMATGVDPRRIEKFIQELAWRDYWQQLWIHHGEAINRDLKFKQSYTSDTEMPASILHAKTGIDAIDRAINMLYETGYMHNHVRMYVAALACNIGRCHWRVPARWMYYHLLDGDWASNALSWQWVAGTNSRKKYIANQQNINKYCRTSQQGSFLDKSYETIADMAIPDELAMLDAPELTLPSENKNELRVDVSRPTILYNLYNLDPNWRKDDHFNRILFFEKAVLEAYPVSARTIDFALQLAKNIPGIQPYYGSYEDLKRATGGQFIFKEHPLNAHYEGIEDARDWLFPVSGNYRSFFAYWKACQKAAVYEVQ